MLLRLIVVFLLTLPALFGCQTGVQNQIPPLYIPEVVTFAGDTIPIHDPDIREKLERELWINAYWHSNTAQLIRKSGKWFPMMDSTLRASGIPEDFKYLVAIESSFENVTSNKGAVGFWQLMEPTAREFGLVINEEVDERLNPYKSTQAAVKLLNRGKNQLGHWSAVAASYNVGITGLRSVMKTQYTDNFYDLLLNQETGRYLFRAVACKIIFNAAKEYGYGSVAKQSPVYYPRERVSASIPDLAYWCRSKGFTYKCFRAANPWIRLNHLTIADTSAGYEVLIPTQCTTYTKLPLPPTPVIDSNVVGILKNLVNQKDMVAFKSPLANPAQLQTDTHEVKAGENLGLIAQKFKLPVSEILELNPGLAQKQNHIRKGWKIRVR